MPSSVTVETIIRGQYQPLEKIGSGGMGDVVKAKDLKLNRLVALKFLRPDVSGDPGRRQRFMQEAQAASALNHPNIITIHDVLTEDGADIMVMEMVSGQSLDRVIPRGGLRVSQVINYSAQVADALAAAHGAGIIHRDLKPGNIMITERDLVKLLDFGLAKLAAGTFSDPDATNLSPLTVQGTIVGTLCYMSPEQAQGKTADARSDIFSFGAVLYEMATGLRAFTGDNAISTLTAVLRDEPRRVLEISPEVPAVLSDVVHRCLHKDPDMRFQNMTEVRNALIRLRQLSESGSLYAQSPEAAATPAAAKPGTTTPAAAKPAATKPGVAKPAQGATAAARGWLWPVVGVAVLVLAVGGWWQFGRTRAERPAPIAVVAEAPPTPAPQTPAPAAAPVAPVAPVVTPPPGPAPPAAPGAVAKDAAAKNAAARPRTTAAPPAAVAAAPVPVKETVVMVISIPDAMPIPLELLTAIPADAAAGAVIEFAVTSDVTIGGEVVIVKGATATGQILENKRRVSIQLKTVTTADGGTINIRATAGANANSNRTIESRGPKPEAVAVARGASTIGYTLGNQTVRLKR